MYSMKPYELSFQKNIRDLGGFVTSNGSKVKYGKIFRGGLLAKLTFDDEIIVKSFGLTDIIDFRSQPEFLKRPDLKMCNANYHNFPAMEDKSNKEDEHLADGNLIWFVKPDSSGFDHMVKTYEDLVTSEAGRSAFRNMFKLMLDKPYGSFYFHCSQGKDRAGLAAFYILLALGVSEQDAREDYLYTNHAMKVRTAYLINELKDRPYFNEQYKQNLIDVFMAKSEYLDAAIAKMKEMRGSILNYIKYELNVDIDRLRQFYLE